MPILAQVFDLILAFSVPPGYRRSKPPVRPKLDPLIGIIDGILEEDKGRPAKQRQKSKRIFERLRDVHGYCGGITIVKDYVQARRQRTCGKCSYRCDTIPGMRRRTSVKPWR